MTDELICGNVTLDLSEVVPVPISYSIADVKEPSKRKKSFSKEITLPATMTNNNFFRGSFRLTSTGSSINFDATAKAEIVLKKRGIQVLKGLIKLNSVVISDGVPSYKCLLFAESVDTFLLLQSISVNELDWSDYDHTLNRTNIKNSWTATIGSGYYYPLIERRQRLGATIWNTTDLIPYVYFREVLLKCFQQVGLTWDSSFLNTTQFKSILFGYGGGDIKTLPSAELNNRKVLVNAGDFNYSATFPYGGTCLLSAIEMFSPSTNNSTYTATEVQDNYNQYLLGETTIQNSGEYTLTMGISLDYEIISSNIVNTLEGMKITVLKNGAQISEILPSSTGVLTSLTGTIVFDNPTETVLSCDSGDVITVIFYGGTLNSYMSLGGEWYDNYDVTINYTTNPLSLITYQLICNNANISDGDTVKISQFLPSMKCSDFFVGAIRQFNLYISDPDEYGVCKVEPLKEFYQNTDTFTDISDVVDYDKEMIIKPSANEYSKNILFNYKKQTHNDFEVYFDKWKEDYNNLNFTQGSYYAKGDYKIELPWATLIPYEISTGILVPRFIKIENNVLKPNAGDPIICFRNGSKSGSWTFKDTIGTGQEVLTTYPCIHHFDNWNSPTFDLSFKLVNELYYIASAITTNNCYSKYYFNFINEMTSSAGQLVTCYVNWSEQDVRYLDYTKFIMINGALFRLNEISEFTGESEDTVKIELVKLLVAKNNNRNNLTVPRIAPITMGFVGSPVGVGTDTGVISGGKGEVLNNSNKIN